MVHSILSTAMAASVATVLFAASFKIRFGLSEQLVLIVPTLVVVCCSVLANIVDQRDIGRRLKLAGLYVFLASASLYSFVLGELLQTELFSRLLINCGLAFFIVLFPWDKRALGRLFLVMVAFGCVLSLDTLSIYDSLDSRRGYEAEIREGYLNVTFATATAALAALFRLIERFHIGNLAAFAVCWVGLALSLGRGSLLFCAFVSMIYLGFAFTMKLSSMGKYKKIGLGLFIASIAPYVIYQVMSVERTAKRMIALFTDTDASSGMQARFEVYDAALQSIATNPVFGNGMGAYLGDPLSTVGYPHNIILQYMVDGGLLGTAVVTGFLAAVVLLLGRALLRATFEMRNTVLCTGALFLLMLLSYMKSHDAYRGLEMFILSALPLAAYGAVMATRTVRRTRTVRAPRAASSLYEPIPR